MDFQVAVEQVAAPASEPPEQVFERAWALTVIERALERLRAEAGQAEEAPMFERLAPFLGETAAPADYRVLGQLGLRPNTVAVTVHRMRTRLRDLVRAELTDQTDGPEGLAIELRAMRAALLSDSSGSGTDPGHVRGD